MITKYIPDISKGSDLDGQENTSPQTCIDTIGPHGKQPKSSDSSSENYPNKDSEESTKNHHSYVSESGLPTDLASRWLQLQAAQHFAWQTNAKAFVAGSHWFPSGLKGSSNPGAGSSSTKSSYPERWRVHV